MQQHPEKWELLARYSPDNSSADHESDILVFRLIGHEGRPQNIPIPVPSTSLRFAN
jgi:hypothetical protein